VLQKVAVIFSFVVRAKYPTITLLKYLITTPPRVLPEVQVSFTDAS